MRRSFGHYCSVILEHHAVLRATMRASLFKEMDNSVALRCAVVYSYGVR